MSRARTPKHYPDSDAHPRLTAVTLRQTLALVDYLPKCSLCQAVSSELPWATIISQETAVLYLLV